MLSLTDISILRTWELLGGGELRHGRGRAFWRSGDSYSISLDEGKSVFYDHRDSRGGGIIALVRIARGCDQRDAIRWLVGQGLVEDERDTRTPQERHKAQRETQELEAFDESFQDAYRSFERELCARRDQLIKLLRQTDDAALELELQILYQRLDSVRACIHPDVTEDDIALVEQIMDIIAESQDETEKS